MRKSMLVMVLGVGFTVTAAEAQTLTDDSVHVGVFGYQPDGSPVAWAFDSLPSQNALVFSSGSGCRLGAGHRELPDYATDAWRFSGKVLSLTPESAVIRLDWQRVLDQGVAVSAPVSSTQLTLRAGDKVLLDQAAGRSLSNCGVFAFEARYGSPATEVVVRLDTSAESSGEGSASGRARPYTVNVWFVRSAPGQPDEVVARPVLTVTKKAVVALAPVTIDAPGGPVVVRVTGSFEVRQGSSGDELLFVAARTVTPVAGSIRDGSGQIQGTAKVTTPMPGPDEVLSFEMPPIRLSGGAELPDRLSVRVQIAPR